MTALALVAGLLGAGPATAAGDDWVLQVDRASQSLSAVDMGSGTAVRIPVTSGLVVESVAASMDGNVVAVIARSGTPSSPAVDSTRGLLVSVGGSTRLVATHVDANAVVELGGQGVWYLSNGDLFRYDVAREDTDPRSGNQAFVDDRFGHLVSFSVSPYLDEIAVVRQTRSDVAPFPIIASEVATYDVRSLYPTRLVGYVYSGGSESPQAAADQVQWIPGSVPYVGYAVCDTGACTTWKTYRANRQDARPWTPELMPELTNSYDLRRVGDSWVFWNDVKVGTATVTRRTRGNMDLSVLDAPTDYAFGSSTASHIPMTGQPAAFSGTAPSAGRASSRASLLLSATTVGTGGSVVYRSVNQYLRPNPFETFPKDADVVQRGSLQSSTDAGRTWTTVRTTTGTTRIAFPGSAVPGNGRTAALSRNTWFRWVFWGDAFAEKSTSPVSLVTVAPKITAKVRASGAKRVVTGKVARKGGTITLTKGGKRIARTRISSAGTFTFGARKLAKGRYVLVTRADGSWASGSRSLSV